MALNKFMHPRNPYRQPPDFKCLAVEYPEFRRVARQDTAGKVKLDWSDPAAVRALTICLLARDFRLQVELPPDCLVPTLPSRQVFQARVIVRSMPCNTMSLLLRYVDLRFPG